MKVIIKLIIIAKQRHGPIGSIKMHFDANYINSVI